MTKRYLWMPGGRLTPLGLVLLLLIHVLAYSAEAQDEQRPKARLTDEFSFNSTCGDRIARMDTLLTELSNNPGAQGVIVIYPELSSEWLAYSHEKQFRNHLAMRSYDATRLTLIQGRHQPEPTIEFWVVPPGAENPELKGEDGAVTGPPPEVVVRKKPWNFSAKYPDGCLSGELFLDGYAIELKADPAAIGSVRIYAPTQAAYLALRKKITAELGGHGISAKRLRFTYTRNRYEEGANLWVVPGARGTRR